MNRINDTWRVFISYMLIIFFILVASGAFAQTKFCKQDICVVEFNASWNEENKVEFLSKLTDCGVVRINIDEGDYKKYNITVVPTVIVFNGKEVERFKADLSFQLTAKLEDVQDVVDGINMNKF